MGTEQLDSLLLPFVKATDNAESERLLSALITEHADPIITKIVNYKMWSGRRAETLSETEDIRSEVILQLLQRLQNFRVDYAQHPITSFNSYVAVTAYNACDRYVSRKYPQRRRLKNGLRYLLTHREGFSLWQDEHQTWVGGLSHWQAGAHASATHRGRDMSEAISGTQRIQLLRDDPRAFTREIEPTSSWSEPKQAYELLRAIFDWTQSPIELDLLTSVVAEWWNVTDETVELDSGSDTERPESTGEQIADKRPDAAVEIERRWYLKRLWDEITELPLRQRTALLLNLRDENGRGVVDLWIIVGIAEPQTVAAILGMTTEEFAELWNELPLEDSRIAVYLGITRQQVINLRKSARERLARRMKGF